MNTVRASTSIKALVDAFVALGGQPDKSGSIRAEVLVDIIKSDFELTIDMEVRASVPRETAIGLFKHNRLVGEPRLLPVLRFA